MIKIDERSLHWLAGFLEGEGSFCKATPNSKPINCTIDFTSTDEDVISRICKAMQISYGKQSPSKLSKKPLHHARISGRRAIELMTKIKPFMGIRRQNQINNVLNSVVRQKRILTYDQIESIKKARSQGTKLKVLEKEFGLAPNALGTILRNEKRKPRKDNWNILSIF